MKVLIAEDDASIRKGLVEILENEGYSVIAVADGNAALESYRIEEPDFICLDIMMPGMNGYDVLKKIRVRDREIPVIFISAKSEEIDRVLGLELGADDYIMKPFGVKEVVARIRAVTRRCLRQKPQKEREFFIMGELTVVPPELRARRGSFDIELSLREVRILDCLERNRGRVVDRNTLLDECWGINYFPNSRTLDQHIAKLRKKIEQDPHNPRIIKTVHGAGYRFEETKDSVS